MQAHLLVGELWDSPSDVDHWNAELISRAEKIAFDPSGLSDGVEQQAEAFARDLLEHGVCPLPYELTLFEFGPSVKAAGETVDCRLWALLWKGKDGLRERVAMKSFSMPAGESRRVFVNPALAEVFLGSPDAEGWWGHFRIVGSAGRAADACSSPAARLEDALAGGARVFAGEPMVSVLDRRPPTLGVAGASLPTFGEVCHDLMDLAFHYVLVAMGLMNTRGIAMPRTAAPAKLNCRRVKKGKPPIFEFRTLVLDPAAAPRLGGAGPGGDRASPRLHMRRGHVRRLPTGRVVMVRPSVVGRAELGIVAKDYRLAWDKEEIDVTGGVPRFFD